VTSIPSISIETKNSIDNITNNFEAIQSLQDSNNVKRDQRADVDDRVVNVANATILSKDLSGEMEAENGLNGVVSKKRANPPESNHLAHLQGSSEDFEWFSADSPSQEDSGFDAFVAEPFKKSKLDHESSSDLKKDQCDADKPKKNKRNVQFEGNYLDQYVKATSEDKKVLVSDPKSSQNSILKMKAYLGNLRSSSFFSDGSLKTPVKTPDDLRHRALNYPSVTPQRLELYQNENFANVDFTQMAMAENPQSAEAQINCELDNPNMITGAQSAPSLSAKSLEFSLVRDKSSQVFLGERGKLNLSDYEDVQKERHKEFHPSVNVITIENIMYQRHQQTSDGHCFYHSIVQAIRNRKFFYKENLCEVEEAIVNSEMPHIRMRQECAKWIREHKNDPDFREELQAGIRDFFPNSDENFESNIEKFCAAVEGESVWADRTLITVASHLLQRAIYVRQKIGLYEAWEIFGSQYKNKTPIHVLLEFNHYDLIERVDE
jgi:hypothetical protein